MTKRLPRVRIPEQNASGPVSGRPETGADSRDLTFRAGGEFTVGAEDELLLVDGTGQLLGSGAASTLTVLRRALPVAGAISGEVFADEVELGTPVRGDAEDMIRALASLRRSVVATGTNVMAAGVHPSAPFGAARTAASPRYDLIVDELAGLLRTPIAAFQVHVGLPDPETAMLAYRGLRNRLYLFRALSAGSPYWHGLDSGLVSARSAVARSYPRVTLPPALRRWEEYVESTTRLVTASELPDYTFVWWDLRPQPRLGTLEVRVMDAQHSLARAAGLASMVQGLARHAVEVPDLDDLPGEVLAANDFRACRYGLDTTVMDLDGCIRPMREIAVRALAEARRMLAPDRLERPLEVIEAMLVEQSEAARQREVHRVRGMDALLADLVERTAAVDV